MRNTLRPMGNGASVVASDRAANSDRNNYLFNKGLLRIALSIRNSPIVCVYAIKIRCTSRTDTARGVIPCRTARAAAAPTPSPIARQIGMAR